MQQREPLFVSCFSWGGTCQELISDFACALFSCEQKPYWASKETCIISAWKRIMHCFGWCLAQPINKDPLKQSNYKTRIEISLQVSANHSCSSTSLFSMNDSCSPFWKHSVIAWIHCLPFRALNLLLLTVNKRCIFHCGYGLTTISAHYRSAYTVDGLLINPLQVHTILSVFF